MCGIVGILGKGEAAPRLIEALRRLEYRGYDSAGIATLRNGSIERRRAEGKLGNLEALLAKSPVTGAGSVITHDIPAGALTIERSQQVDIPGGADKLREKKRAIKAAAKA